MKTKILFCLLTFIGIYNLAISQNELVIELTTDSNAEENRWVLYDLSKTVIQESIVFSDLTTYRDTIYLDSDQCFYWTLYDSYGDGMNSGFTPGSYRIYFDGALVEENTGINFGDSISVFNLGEACMPNDIGLMQVEVLNFISKEPAFISASFLNMGKGPISSMEIYYQVNDFTSEYAIIEGLNIPVGEIGTVTHPNPFDFNVAGNYTVRFIVVKINGTVDSYEDDNTLSKEVTVVDGIVKKNMVEMMTSSSGYCPYCYDVNVNVDNTLLQYPGTYSMAKYFPEWWGDTKYIPGNDHRAGLYSDWMSEGSLFMNGSPIYYVAFPTNYMDSLGQVSDVKLTLSGYLKGDSIFATVTVLPMKTIDEAVYLRGVAVQHFCHDNQIRGGEFLHPTYGYLPSPEGVEMEMLTQGVELTFSFSGSIVDYPLEEGSLQDMILNFYVQKKLGREILQSENRYLTYDAVLPTLSYNITNGATSVDTANLAVLAKSNRILFNKNGQPITNIKDHIVFKQGSVNGISVPFDAVLNETENQILVNPTYEWNTNTKYYVIFRNLATIDNVLIPNDTLEFTTLPYIVVSDQPSDFVTIHPNPVYNSITISSEKGTLVQILSANGQIMESLVNFNGTLVHNLSDYSSGLYFVSMETRAGHKVVKFIKQ